MSRRIQEDLGGSYSIGASPTGRSPARGPRVLQEDRPAEDAAGGATYLDAKNRVTVRLFPEKK